jgi:hypothetical protein
MFERLFPDNDADYRTKFYFMKVQNQNPDIQRFIGEWNKVEQIVFASFENQKKIIKFHQLDGTMTVLYKFWKAWLDRNTDDVANLILIQRIAFLLPLIYLKERSISLGHFGGPFEPVVEAYCERERKFCNFDEKHKLLTQTQSQFANGTLSALIHGWQQKNN